MRILGIDPGTAIVGYGIIDVNKNKCEVVDYGCIYTDKSASMPEKLLDIHEQLTSLIEKYNPDEMAVEELFYFKNNKTVISVGQARGVIVLSGIKKNLVISEYTPLQVKMGITGYGRAEKKQVQIMVQKFLGLESIPKPDDAADALAICITHMNSMNSALSLFNKNQVNSVKTGKDKISAKEYREMLLKK